MPITSERLDAFIDAYERANGGRLSREEAQDAALRVLAFVELLSKPPAHKSAEPGAGYLTTTPDPQTPAASPPVCEEGDAPRSLPGAS
jgi:hypothetical protein